MKKSRFTDAQIVNILKQAEQGVPVSNILCDNIRQSTFYKWRSKYDGINVSLITRHIELEAQNARLKKMYAEERIKSDILQDAILKEW